MDWWRADGARLWRHHHARQGESRPGLSVVVNSVAEPEDKTDPAFVLKSSHPIEHTRREFPSWLVGNKTYPAFVFKSSHPIEHTRREFPFSWLVGNKTDTYAPAFVLKSSHPIEHTRREFPSWLVGNKTDLSDKRQVSTDEGERKVKTTKIIGPNRSINHTESRLSSPSIRC